MEGINTILQNRAFNNSYNNRIIKKAVIKKSKNNKRYIKQDDHLDIFKTLVPNKQWHNKYARMILDDGDLVTTFANWVLNNKKITNKLRYFAKSCGKKNWDKTKSFIKRLIKNADIFTSNGIEWLSWITIKASEAQIIGALEGKNPPALLSYMLSKQ